MDLTTILNELSDIRQRTADLESDITRLLIENKFYDDTTAEYLVETMGYEEDEAKELATA